uniref:Uncharacterized protein n=1 Tax=Glossina austeni TaxID=7395 RepID=A0A1A9V4R1_GLOAU
MENIKVPKKVERHAIKAVKVLCEGDEAKCVTESEILHEVRYQTRNLVPVADIKGVLHKCLLELSVRRIIRRVDDENFGMYSGDRDEYSSDHDHAIEGSESSEVDSATSLQSSLVAPNQVISKNGQRNEYSIFQDNDESLPIPMQIKREIDADDSGGGIPALCGNFDKHLANSIALFKASPVGTIRFTIPMLLASSAQTCRPVNIKSRARDNPIIAGRRAVPPSITGTPKRRLKKPNTAESSITRKSHINANSKPISKPEQNEPPIPYNTATGEASSASKALKASQSLAAVCPSIALRCRGLLIPIRHFGTS